MKYDEVSTMSGIRPSASRTKSTPFFFELEQRIAAMGGQFNAHLHLDRAGTYRDTVDMLAGKGKHDGAYLPLAGKHALIPMIHASPLYDRGNLMARVGGYLEDMAAIGATRADTVVDTTADRVGTSALDALIELKDGLRGRLDLQVGAYSPLGNPVAEPHRWELLVEGAGRADFIGLLPERDDRAVYPDNIGFRECCRRGIELATSLQRKIHIHVDQSNHQHESGSEAVVAVVRELGAAVARDQEPLIWLIHVISPSTYDEARFRALVDDLAELNIGIITCPSAAISMRQVRHFASPTFNSIARVLDFLAAGLHVRMGSDNICDITSPMGTIDLIDELFVLSNALRYYDIDVLATLAAGRRVDAAARERIRRHLADDTEMAAAAVAGAARQSI